MSRHRAQHRKHRKQAGAPTVALVGYTNAGKRWGGVGGGVSARAFRFQL